MDKPLTVFIICLQVCILLIFDDNGCVNSGFFSITEPSISVFETITNVSCNGYNDSSINLNISGESITTVNTAGTSQVLGGGINTF